ncbi:uncharacterized protein LOC131169352 [Hevea brasiliensis]|uniref:uncharacterized protein LOC131169352 n=1 Tax=Hevea brasiliensis TaxID=3981 RepID=UPI0025E57A94|nr:uncharacterized protein LOC131169352 [Hevea brasiliensis]
MSTQPQPSNVLASILNLNKLTSPNFSNWLRNLRIFLNLERIGYILDSKVPGPLPKGATKEERDTLDRWKEHNMRARCYMLAFMTNELQKQHEKMHSVSEILDHLHDLYYEHSRNAKYEISKQFFRMRIIEGWEVGAHVHRMIQLIEQLEALISIIDFQLQTNLILQSLLDSFGSFITNFHMTKQKCTLAGLLNLWSLPRKICLAIRERR